MLMKNKTFLIIDDYEVMIQIIITNLVTLGANRDNILKASNGVEALKALKQHDFDLVISDWNMPVMNGLELLKAIREDATLCRTSVMMITGEAESKILRKVVEVGIDSLLLKPFSLASFSEKIELGLNARQPRG
jgi:CheY-like chemotaxis protein